MSDLGQLTSACTRVVPGCGTGPDGFPLELPRLKEPAVFRAPDNPTAVPGQALIRGTMSTMHLPVWSVRMTPTRLHER